MAVLVNNSIFSPGRVDNKINHPDGGEDEEDDEENLQVRYVDVYFIVSAAADQTASQDQNIETEDPRKHPSPVSNAFLPKSTGGNVQVGLTRALGLAWSADVVGQVSLFSLPVFDHHPAWLTKISIVHTFARKATVQTHGSRLQKHL